MFESTLIIAERQADEAMVIIGFVTVAVTVAATAL